jgi:hypothetical protein
MIKAHVYLDNKLVFDGRLHHPPRKGETIRVNVMGQETYGIVNEVVWCLDEPSDIGQRVNIRASREKTDG